MQVNKHYFYFQNMTSVPVAQKKKTIHIVAIHQIVKPIWIASYVDSKHKALHYYY